MSFSSFLSSLKGKSVLILTHVNSDIDSISAAAAMQFLLNKKGFKAVIGIPDHINSIAKNLAEKFSIKYSINPCLKEFDGLIFVDLNSLNRIGSLEKEAIEFQNSKKPIYLIDHHIKSKERITTNSLTSKKGKTLSTCELVVNLFKEQKIKLNKKIASLLASGVLIDSAGLYIANFETLSTMSELLKKSNNSIADILSIIKLKTDFSEKIAQLKAAKRIQIFKAGEFIICLTNVGAFESISAFSLIKLGADLAFAGSSEEETIRVSGRASNEFIKTASFNLTRDVMQKLSNYFQGHGGGHPGAAGFTGKHSSTEQVLQKCFDLTIEFLKQKNPNLEVKEYTD